jgi:hypothetical protein
LRVINEMASTPLKTLEHIQNSNTNENKKWWKFWK